MTAAPSRRALVTGGSRGGGGSGLALAAGNTDVIAVDRNESGLVANPADADRAGALVPRAAELLGTNRFHRRQCQRGTGVYAIRKHALSGMTRLTSSEFARWGITANAPLQAPTRCGMKFIRSQNDTESMTRPP
jgi:NAD(P)-dependent dehydrogenase (short-subunit alcohol dehydrogenase family)